MHNLHISNSYKTWKPSEMKKKLIDASLKEYNSYYPDSLLHRMYEDMYVEWWLHNIGYYITKPFCFNNKVKAINLRFKDVDLEEWK